MGRKILKTIGSYTEENVDTDRVWYRIINDQDKELGYSSSKKPILIQCILCNNFHRMKPSRILLDGTSCTCCSKNYNKEIRETLSEMGYTVENESLEVEKCFVVSEEDNDELEQTGNKKKKNIRMDYCIPSKQIVIELNGGGNHYLKKHQDLDEWKRKICEKNGFKLVYIKTKGSKIDPNHKAIIEEALEEDESSLNEEDS